VTGAELQFREFFAAEYGRLRGLEADVARLLGLPLGTVKSLAHRGLARLRGELGTLAMEPARADQIGGNQQ
jgi:hypothetical protein